MDRMNSHNIAGASYEKKGSDSGLVLFSCQIGQSPLKDNLSSTRNQSSFFQSLV